MRRDAQGRYFFTHIARDGIALCQSDDTDLPEPRPKTPAQALAIAKEYFEEWLPSVEGRVRLARYAIEQGLSKHAAFEFQVPSAIITACWRSAHLHLARAQLGFLRTQAEQIDTRLIKVWPRELTADRSRFEKLKDAYVKARYSNHYSITEDELAWLSERVEALGQVVEAVCAGRTAKLQGDSGRTE